MFAIRIFVCLLGGGVEEAGVGNVTEMTLKMEGGASVTVVASGGRWLLFVSFVLPTWSLAFLKFAAQVWPGKAGVVKCCL